MPETMREALESAFDKFEEEDNQPVVEESLGSGDESDEPMTHVSEEPVQEELEASDKSQRVRDEKGRFTKQVAQADNKDDSGVELGSQADSATVDDSQTIDPQLDELIQNRPSSFKSEAVWRKLVEGKASEQDQRYLAKYYINRENDYHKGLEPYKAEAAKNYYLANAIEQYIPLLQQQRIDPGQFVKNLAHTHYQLSTGSQEQKLAVLYQAARDYGINLVQTDQGIALAPMHPNEQLIEQQLQATRREVDDMKKWREQENRAKLQSEINQLVADKNNFPHFDELREDMALLLENGHSSTFEQAYAEAYRRATRFSNVARPPQSNPQRVQQAKRVAISPKSGKPTAPPSNLKSQGNLRADLNSAWDHYS